jgi:hypothetical protein
LQSCKSKKPSSSSLKAARWWLSLTVTFVATILPQSEFRSFTIAACIPAAFLSGPFCGSESLVLCDSVFVDGIGNLLTVVLAENVTNGSVSAHAPVAFAADKVALVWT